MINKNEDILNYIDFQIDVLKDTLEHAKNEIKKNLDDDNYISDFKFTKDHNSIIRISGKIDILKEEKEQFLRIFKDAE